MTSTNRGDIKLMIDQLTHLESIDDSVTDAAITMLEAMGNELAQCQKELASKQAKIDSLMLEYCPDEMTEAQFSKWGECQMPHGKADAIKLEDRTAELEAALREARDTLQHSATLSAWGK